MNIHPNASCVWFLLAHHDDEYFLGTHLYRLATSFDHLVLFYLTRDSLCQKQREYETRGYLARLGVKNATIIDLGETLGIVDGTLFYEKNWQSALTALSKVAPSIPLPKQIVTPAWEGGHHDHDICNYLAVRLITYWQTNLSCEVGGREYKLYNANRIPAPWFRLSGFHKPLSDSSISECESLLDRLRHLALVISFKSQWRSFLGLWPFILLHRLLGHRIWLTTIDLQRNFKTKPFAEPSFYERRFGISWEAFSKEIR